MKTIMLLIVITMCCVGEVQSQEFADSTPKISLFESAERIKSFLKSEAKQDYSDKYLAGITLHYFDGHPKKGIAWVYSFSFKRPQLGGDISIYHFMDGEVIEFNHGP